MIIGVDNKGRSHCSGSKENLNNTHDCMIVIMRFGLGNLFRKSLGFMGA